MLLKVKYKTSYNPSHTGYNFYPDVVEYIGHVVPLKHLSDNEFALTTGDYDAPVRVLDKRDIISAWVDRSNKPDNVSIVENKYVVTAGPFNRHSCTCTAFKFRKWCNHINEVKKNARVSTKQSCESISGSKRKVV